MERVCVFIDGSNLEISVKESFDKHVLPEKLAYKLVGTRRLIKAFYCSINGLKVAFQGNVSFRQEVFLGILIVPLARVLKVTVVKKIFLICSWFLVLIMEIINSAIELIVDRISLEVHPLSKKIKDMGSAGVLLSILNMIFIWGIIGINCLLD